jgi:CheY-like chemotaxis protein/anti-sigma regulatory factor (Ser/Thr protein kinase)
LKLINDVLDFSKIETGKLVLETVNFDLHQLIQDTSALFGEQARQKGLALEVHVSATLPACWQGDLVRLRQVLINLLGNAIKFTSKGRVTLQVDSERVTAVDGSLKFQISDTGIGISPEVQPYVFDAFTQANRTITRQYGGTGLGLAICKQLVTLMGGEIGLYSLKGHGSNFWFRVTLARPKMDARDPVSSCLLRPLTRFDAGVLVVEDNPVNQEVTRAMLEMAGCRVDIAVNGREAVEATAQQSYDLVLMDCEMPVLDGFAATAEIRSREQNSGLHVPITALTANVTKGFREECLQVGMDDYLSKPFDFSQLMGILMKFLGSL